MMMFFEIWAISGMSFSAWRSEEAASAKPRSKLVTVSPSVLRLNSLGAVKSEASSTGPEARVLELRLGRDAVQLHDALQAVLRCVPKASRKEPATTSILALSWLE